MKQTNTVEAGEPKTQSQFTPGPWRIGDQYKSTRGIYGRSVDPFDGLALSDRDTYICAVQEGRWIYEQAANARLIAAAPELLEALKEAAELLRPLVHAMNVRTHFHEKNVLANVIEKAIRKAEAQS